MTYAQRQVSTSVLHFDVLIRGSPTEVLADQETVKT